MIAFWNKKKEDVAPQPQVVVNPAPGQRLLERLPLDFVAIKAKFDLEDKAAKKTEHSELQKQLKLIRDKNIKTKTKEILEEEIQEDEALVEEEDNNSLHNLNSNLNIPAFKPKFKKIGAKKLMPKNQQKYKYSLDDINIKTHKPNYSL